MGEFTRICASKIFTTERVFRGIFFRSNNPQGCEGEARNLGRVPMRRAGHPSEVAAAIAFLAVNAVAFITGQTLFVDGGASLGTL
jgi:3-oxoacyl-[acyl-carrier protein] reductase